MGIIYEPNGRAREYAALACNLYNGCKHACRYCYCPNVFKRTLDEWSADQRPKVNAIDQFRREARKLAGDEREILFSFASDCFQTPEAAQLTTQALRICAEYGLHATVLTKNPEATRPLWPLFKEYDFGLGTTVIFLSETLRAEWEPGAPEIKPRLRALRDAHRDGVRTWASVEPCVDVAEGVAAIKTLLPIADVIKVGKLNHHPHASRIDWRDFLEQAREALGDHPHLIKHDLLAYGAGVTRRAVP